jgi:ribonuclease-3
VVADIAYHRYPLLPEGKLTDLRKAVVNAAALATVAEQLEIGRELLLGKGEAAAGGRHKPSILSDAFEAVLAAVYLDGGVEAAQGFVERWVGPRMDDVVTRLDGLDHKTSLQELLARLGSPPPRYVLEEEGPDHAKVFHARVVVGDEVWGEGTGRSKKQAEQAAAEAAYRRGSELPSLDGARPAAGVLPPDA